MKKTTWKGLAYGLLVPGLLLVVAPVASAHPLGGPVPGGPGPLPPIGMLPSPGQPPTGGPLPAAPTTPGGGTSVQDSSSDNVFQIGPPIQVPPTTPVTVTILSGQLFDNASNVTTPVNLPSGRWGDVVLTIHGTESGVQYDRLMQVWAGSTQIFTGVTPEPTATGISWTVKKEVTNYLPVLMGKQVITNECDNYPSSTYTGIPDITETLTFYPAGPGAPPSTAPSGSMTTAASPAAATGVQSTTASVYADAGSALPAISSQGPAGPVGGLPGSASQVPSSIVPLQSTAGMTTLNAGGIFTSTVNLPDDITGAKLDLYLIPQIGEEFWWGNEPAFREIDVSIDGQPAGVVWPYPYIYTGGINPLLWQPLTGIHTLDIPAYQLNITPFAGMLGGKHTISLTVEGNTGYWLVSGSLMLDRMPGVTTTGGITQDTLSFPASAPSTLTNSPGSGNSLLTQSANRNYTIAGTITTPAGTWDSSVQQSMQWTNDQTNTTANYFGLVHAVQVVNTTSTLSGPGTPTLTRQAQDLYTLDVADGYVQGATGNAFLLPANTTQMLSQDQTVQAGAQTLYHSGLYETIQSYGALQTDPQAFEYSSTGYADYHNTLGQTFRHVMVTNQGQVLVDNVSGTLGPVPSE